MNKEIEKQNEITEDDLFTFLTEEIDTFEKTYEELSKKGKIILM